MADLYKIAETANNALGHVVFVHGLGGHPYETFQNTKGDSSTLWPLWVAEDVPGINVWTLGYQAPQTNFTGQALGLRARALSVIDRLTQDDRISGDLPIVFVCHSLGGLVIKQMLKIASAKMRNDDSCRLIIKRTKGLVFLATPHLGARMATWADWFRFTINRSQAVLDMTYGNPSLDELNDWFRNWSARPPTLVYRETLGISIFGKVVSKFEGDPKLNGVDAREIQRDHFQIVKPPDKNDLVHIGVINLIRTDGVICAKEEFETAELPTPFENQELLRWQKVPLLPRIFRTIPILVGILAIILMLVSPDAIERSYQTASRWLLKLTETLYVSDNSDLIENNIDDLLSDNIEIYNKGDLFLYNAGVNSVVPLLNRILTIKGDASSEDKILYLLNTISYQYKKELKDHIDSVELVHLRSLFKILNSDRAVERKYVATFLSSIPHPRLLNFLVHRIGAVEIEERRSVLADIILAMVESDIKYDFDEISERIKQVDIGKYPVSGAKFGDILNLLEARIEADSGAMAILDRHSLHLQTRNSLTIYETINKLNLDRKINRINLGHTVKPNAGHTKAVSEEVVLRGLLDFQTKTLNQIDLEAHFYVAPSGAIWIGRDLNTPPSITLDRNGNRETGPVSIQMIIDGSSEIPSHEQRMGLASLLDSLQFFEPLRFALDSDIFNENGFTRNLTDGILDGPGNNITGEVVQDWYSEWENTLASNGQQFSHLLPKITEQKPLRVVAFSGLLGAGARKGTAKISRDFNKMGAKGSHYNHRRFKQVMSEILSEHDKGDFYSELAIIGHGVGADRAVVLANQLAESGLRVRCLVTFDPTKSVPVSSLIQRADNYLSGSPFGQSLQGAVEHKFEQHKHIGISQDTTIHKEIIANCV